MRPRLALVPGEPAGVGPELCVRLAQRPADGLALTAFGDAATLNRAATALGLPLRLLPADTVAERPGDLPLHDIPLPGAPPAFGEPDPANARAVIASLTTAAQACLDGRCQGLVTGPTHKASLNAGGIRYTGTTELLAEMSEREVVMMLARPGLRVALATTHLPLRAVADALTPPVLERTLRITGAALREDFGIQAPRIAVLGLNPHAGEEGHLGLEEIEVMQPVIDRLRGEGFDLVGPLPADTAFLPGKLPGFDAVVAMYHDQGLPVLKSAGIDLAVNITLGLPFPRAAVDHGTALDIAGRGIADPASLIAATDLCADLARHRIDKASP
ncbi:MAG: 4-hydroxythreonine-4-phosphate dehydrogenase PdxA [Xanthomonadaceae bacterium]|nr:4-hydroxythreonine-4-phosphate dehydrogenase PdxA [Xanthomonadaceae bacterium]